MKPKSPETAPIRCPEIAQAVCRNPCEVPGGNLTASEVQGDPPGDSKPPTPRRESREETTRAPSRRPNKFPFTDRRIERLKPKRKRRCYYDTKCPGLELRVSPTGYKVFSFVGYHGRRQRVGQCPPVTVKLAREVANEKRLSVELGESPVQRETLGELWEKYREDMIARDRAPTSLQLWGRCYRYLEHWEGRRLQQITPDMMLEVVGSLRKRGCLEHAKNVARLLRAMTNFAIRRGWKGRSPVAGIGFPKTRGRSRFIEPHELYGFISTLEKREDVFGDLILVTLFTGARKRDVYHAKWADVDLERRKWSFIGKCRIERTVYLSDYVLEIFRRRAAQAAGGAELVFASPITERPVGWVRRILYRAEMEARKLPVDTVYLSIKNQFSMHVLRHTFITYALRAGVPVQVLQAMVGHRVDRRITVAVYAHSTEKWERRGFQKVAKYIHKVASQARPKVPEATKDRLPMESVSWSEKELERKPPEKKKHVPYPRPRSRLSGTRHELARAKFIEEIMALYKAGRSTREIAALLTEEGKPITHAFVWKALHKLGLTRPPLGREAEKQEEPK